MCRLLLCAAVALLLAAAPRAAGATLALRDDVRAVGVALAGPDVIVMRELPGGTTQLVAVPRTGGRARTLLSVRSVQPVFEGRNALAASDRRVALIAEIIDRHERTIEWRVYSGPPSGPLEVIRRIPGRDGWQPALVDVDGDRVLIVELREEDEVAARAFVFDPGAGLVPLPWVSGSAVPVALAGDHAAAAVGPRAAVVDLETGAEQAAVPVTVPSERQDFDLAADARLVLSDAGGVTVAGVGSAARVVPGSRDLSRAAFAGEDLAAFDGDGRPVLLRADGSRTPLGLPSLVVTASNGDAQGFAWVANGCVRYAAVPVTATARAQVDDPCPATEIALVGIGHSKLRGRTVRVSVRCVAAPAGVCRGTVLGKEGVDGRRFVARGRFTVPMGKERDVTMRIERATAERFRRARSGSFVLDARVPNGRVGSGGDGSAELSVDVG